MRTQRRRQPLKTKKGTNNHNNNSDNNKDNNDDFATALLTPTSMWARKAQPRAGMSEHKRMPTKAKYYWTSSMQIWLCEALESVGVRKYNNALTEGGNVSEPWGKSRNREERGRNHEERGRNHEMTCCLRTFDIFRYVSVQNVTEWRLMPHELVIFFCKTMLLAHVLAHANFIQSLFYVGCHRVFLGVTGPQARSYVIMSKCKQERKLHDLQTWSHHRHLLTNNLFKNKWGCKSKL